jgi:hypothetical protein
MDGGTGPASTLDAWRGVRRKIETAIEGLTESDLDLRGGPDGWSIRETVHHLVESNLVASNIILAALAKDGWTYDWSWVTPDGSWMKRVGYDRAPTGPALEMVGALVAHVSGLLGAVPDAPGRQVRLLDAPGAEPYARTVEQIVRQEVDHVADHLEGVAQTRELHAR